MRFTPTATYASIAKSASKEVAWQVFVKKTTDISELLTTGDWIEVTRRLVDIPDTGSSIEYEVGQFTADSISLTGHDVRWWKDNIFNVTENTYLELKIAMTLSQGSDVATDTVVVFSGFIDKIGVSFVEIQNSVTFTAFTSQELGSRKAAEILTTQYLENDVKSDGSNLQGLILFEIPNVYVTDANVVDYPLSVGSHKITYKWSSEAFSTGSDQIINGDFGSDEGWVKGTGWTISGGKAICSGSQNPNTSALWQFQTLEAGASYTLTYTVSNRTAGNVVPYLGANLGTARITNATFTETLVAPANNVVFKFLASATFNGRIDNVTLTRNARTVVTYTLQLDDGLEVPVTTGNEFVTLGNGKDGSPDTDQVQVYVRALTDLTITNEPLESPIVVTTQGDTLPKQWYYNVGLRYLLDTLYSNIGITDITHDTLEIPVPPTEPAKASFIDFPPNDGAVVGTKWAMTTDGTDLYLAVGHKVYKRSTANETYSLIATLSTGDRISKLMYNSRNAHLWMVYGNVADDFNQNTHGNGKLRRYDVGSSTLSSEIVLTTVTDMSRHYSIEVIDYNYSGSNYVYGVAFTDGSPTPNAGRLRFVNGSSLVVSTIFTGEDYGFTGNIQSTITANFMFVRNGNEVWFKGVEGIGSADKLCKAHINTSGSWVNDGVIISNLDPYVVAAYHPTDDRIYYWLYVNSAIQSHTVSSGATSGNLIGIPFEILSIDTMYYANGKVWFTIYDPDPFIAGRFNYLYAYSDNEQHDFQDYLELSNLASTTYTGLVWSGDRLYGLDRSGKLFQYCRLLKCCIKQANFAGQKITEALNKTLQSFNMVGNVSATKKAFCFQRGDGNGIPYTTGNTLAISVDNAADIREDTLTYSKVALVELSNGKTTVNFNGSEYNTNVLSDVRILQMSNDLIPDELIKDLTYHVFQFFSVDRTLYTLPVTQPLFMFEPLDNANFSFSTTNIQKTAIGNGHPIYSVKYMKTDPMMEVTVMA